MFYLSLTSLYCPSNRDIKLSWETISKECSIRKKVVIYSDTTAYHPNWGSILSKNEKYKRKRGVELVELLNELELNICNNTPHMATFVRNAASTERDKDVSHIDVTFCAEKAYRNLRENVG